MRLQQNYTAEEDIASMINEKLEKWKSEIYHIMKKIQYILAGTMLVSLSLGAQAQTQPQDTTMNRTVVVEQEYNPDIMDASKVNVLPRVEPPTVSKKAVEYDATLMPATQIPAGIMQAYTGKETQAKALPGYVRL